MEVASLTLGAVPIAAKLLSSCLQGYQMLSEVSSVGEDAQILLCRLQIEETRLRLWAEDLGAHGLPLDDQLEKRGVKNLVILILAHTCALFTNFKRLRSRYGIIYPDVKTKHGEQCSVPVLPSESFAGIVGGQSNFSTGCEEAVRKYAEHTQQTLSIMQKLRFVLKDKNRFSGMLKQFQYFNDSLMSFISPAHRARLDFILSSKMLDNTEDLLQLSRIKAASQERNMSLSSTAMMKRSRLEIENRAAVYISSSQLRCKGEDLSLDDPLAQRSLGRYGKPGSERKIVAEWKHYDRNLSREISVGRIQDIARYLHAKSSCRSPDLPILECLGYVEDITQSRCCLIYLIPEEAGYDIPAPLTTLADLIPARFDAITTPNLEHRFALARVLAVALFRLHLTGWLHKGMCSSNIAFLGAKMGRDLQCIVHPTLMGFDYSRPNQETEESEHSPYLIRGYDLYTHPDYQKWNKPAQANRASEDASDNGQRRYKMAYDIYSLGLILVEIALWQPVGVFFKKKHSAQEFRDEIMKTVMTELGHVMGRKYRDVVKECLEWNQRSVNLPGGTEEKAEEFLKVVVNPLYECP